MIFNRFTFFTWNRQCLKHCCKYGIYSNFSVVGKLWGIDINNMTQCERLLMADSTSSLFSESRVRSWLLGAWILFSLVIVIACIYFAQASVTLNFVGNMQTSVTLIFLTSAIKLLRRAAGKKATNNCDDGDDREFLYQNSFLYSKLQDPSVQMRRSAVHEWRLVAGLSQSGWV